MSGLLIKLFSGHTARLQGPVRQTRNKRIMKAIVKRLAVASIALMLPGMIATAKEVDSSNVDLSRKGCMPRNLKTDKRIDLTGYSDPLIYVDFWASWCGPCKLSFPFLNELHDDFAKQGLKIVAISVDKEDKDAKKFVRHNPAYFTLAIDSRGICPKVFDVKGMPSSYIIDKDGNILYQHQGFRSSDPEKIRKALAKIMED